MAMQVHEQLHNQCILKRNYKIGVDATVHSLRFSYLCIMEHFFSLLYCIERHIRKIKCSPKWTTRADGYILIYAYQGLLVMLIET